MRGLGLRTSTWHPLLTRFDRVERQHARVTALKRGVPIMSRVDLCALARRSHQGGVFSPSLPADAAARRRHPAAAKDARRRDAADRRCSSGAACSRISILGRDFDLTLHRVRRHVLGVCGYGCQAGRTPPLSTFAADPGRAGCQRLGRCRSVDRVAQRAHSGSECVYSGKAGGNHRSMVVARPRQRCSIENSRNGRAQREHKRRIVSACLPVSA